MRLTEEEMKKRKEKMIYNAFQLFCKKGIESVKLTEIAKKSGVSEATVYRYFGNKEQLVLEAFLKLWDMIMSRVYIRVEETAAYDSMTGYEQIQVWLEGFRHLYQEDEDFILFSYEAKLYFLRHNMKFDRAIQDAQMHSFYKPCVAALDKGKKDGSIPVAEDSKNLFYAIWGAIRGYVAKIVIYGKLYEYGNPWESRYRVMEAGILSALSSGWNSGDSGNASGAQVEMLQPCTAGPYDSAGNASGAQMEMLQQIPAGTEQLANMIQNNSATAEESSAESSAASEELSAQAESLKEIAAQFKLRR